MIKVAEKKNEMKVRVPKGARLTRFALSPAGKILLASVALVSAAGASSVFCFETLPGRRRLATDLGATHVYNPVEVEKAGRTAALVSRVAGKIDLVQASQQLRRKR